MIVLSNNSPGRSLYYLGAMLVAMLKTQPFRSENPLLLFEKFTHYIDIDISFSHFLFVLDWLYLIGLVDLTDSGDITACF